MKYPYVWVTIGGAQAAFVVLVAMLEYVGRSRSAAEGGDEPATSDGRAVWRLAASRFWWRRMAAARRLSVVADIEDRAVIRQLLLDPHPGVQSAATACLLRYADEGLVALLIESLASRSAAVRMYQATVLRQRSALVMPLLLDRLHTDVAPAQLHTYIALAESLDSRECLERVAALSIHSHPEVRLAVAKVLQQFGDESTAIKLLTMLRDPDWRVRAQAARGLGAIGDERAIPELARALTDRTWWVRFRAGLALAMMGESGRAGLTAAEDFPDRYARDMISFVKGLSASSIAELSEG